MSSNAEGGHTGIAGSVGGSGGQISLAVGSVEAATRGGHVGTTGFAGSAGGTLSGSPTGSAGAGRVCAHVGAVFCIGSAGLGSGSSTTAGSSSGVAGWAQEGAGFCMGRAGMASVSPGGSDAAGPNTGSEVERSAGGSDAGSNGGSDAARCSACADATGSNGSSGSVCGSKVAVTSGNSGSFSPAGTSDSGIVCARKGWVVSRAGLAGTVGSVLVSGTGGAGGFSSCGSTRRSVYRRSTKAAAPVNIKTLPAGGRGRGEGRSKTYL